MKFRENFTMIKFRLHYVEKTVCRGIQTPNDANVQRISIDLISIK
jgi:hypothetical protein